MANYSYYGQNYANPYMPNYYPTAYQQPMQPITQPQMQNVPQMQSQPQNAPIQSYSPVINQNGIIWISGLQEAQMYPIAPNAAVALWQKDGKTIFLKSADATGRPSLKIYDLVERVEETSESAPTETASYAKEEDVGKLASIMKSMSDIIDNMKVDVDTLKTDVYGLSGKRKPIKKAESEGEE